MDREQLDRELFTPHTDQERLDALNNKIAALQQSVSDRRSNLEAELSQIRSEREASIVEDETRLGEYIRTAGVLTEELNPTVEVNIEAPVAEGEVVPVNVE